MAEGGKVIRISENDTPSTFRVDLEEEAVKWQAQRPVADIVFIIDTTGSMSDKIDGLVQRLQSLADQLNEKATDWSAAIVAFGDLTVRGDTIAATAFTSKVDVLKKSLGTLPRNSGGSNEGESSFEALQKAATLPGYRPNAMRVFVLLTDEPALVKQISPQAAVASLRRNGILTFVISPAIDYFKAMAKDTGGEWLEISAQTDMRAILNMFDRLAASVAERIKRVQTVAGGDVSEYLRLAEGQR